MSESFEKSNLSKIKKIFRSPALAAIYRWSKPVHGAVCLLSIVSVLRSLLSLGVTLVTKSLIDGAVSADIRAIWMWGAALVALILAGRLISVWTAYISVKASAGFQKHMQSMVTDAILGKEYASIKSYHSGELVSRVFSDVSVVQGGIMSLMPSILQTVVSFIGAAIILIAMDWRFLPLLILVSLIGAGIAVLFRTPMKNRHLRMQAAEAALHASTQETLENIRIVKASSSEERASAAMDEYRDRLVNEQLRNGRLSIAFSNGVGLAFDISWLLCNLWGCLKIFQGTFTYGSLAALIQLIGRIQGPIANAVSLVSQIYGVVASAERLQEVVGLPDEERGTKLDGFDAVRLEHAYFQYDDGMDDVLIDVNFTINRGDFVALTGISGGGKTSLFQLLLGIYKPTSGSVLFRQGSRLIPACKETRGLFAYVPQGNMLFSGTLRDNLTMFTDHAGEEEIREAVKAACLEDLIASVGYDTVLGERGIGLSEGQAQRVAVARALLSGAPILLLDEATSALDEATEARLLGNISAMRDKTVIIVTHRRAALSICDYMLQVADGRVARLECSSF